MDDVKLPSPFGIVEPQATVLAIYSTADLATYARAAVLADREARWMKIEEDALVDVPLDTVVLLAWWDEWSEEWKIETNYAGSERGGWRHGRATHWMPLPAPPQDNKDE